MKFLGQRFQTGDEKYIQTDTQADRRDRTHYQAAFRGDKSIISVTIIVIIIIIIINSSVTGNNKSAQSNLGTGPRRGSCARRWLA